MYIIYLYIIYILFISLFRRFKNSSQTDPPHVCYDLIVICYLLCLCPSRTAMRTLVEGEKCFTVVCDSTAIARRFHRNPAAIVCHSPFPMFHAACRLVTPTPGTDGSKLAIVCKSISCAKVTGILTPLLAGCVFIS